MGMTFVVSTAVIALMLVVYWVIEAVKFVISLLASIGECNWSLTTSNEKTESGNV